LFVFVPPLFMNEAPSREWCRNSSAKVLGATQAAAGKMN
jgi:hypothetical protein